MNRRGVVLLITIGFITAIMAIIGYQFTIVDRGLKRVSQESFYYQSALLLNDVQKKLLPTVVKEVRRQCGTMSREDCMTGFLEMSYNLPTPLINDPQIGTVVITLKPPSSGFDPNSFKTIPSDKRGFFTAFAQELIDPQLLMELIDLALDTNDSVHSSYLYLKNDDDIPINDVFFRKGNIVDREQFDQILDAYYSRTLDKKVYALEWDDFLDFRTSGGPLFYLMKESYCRALFPDQPPEWLDTYCKNESEIQYTQEDVTGIPADDLNITVNDYHLIFDPDPDTVLIEVDFSHESDHARFRFMYGLASGKIRWTDAHL
jgi:hypothetical protein